MDNPKRCQPGIGCDVRFSLDGLGHWQKIIFLLSNVISLSQTMDSRIIATIKKRDRSKLILSLISLTNKDKDTIENFKIKSTSWMWWNGYRNAGMSIGFIWTWWMLLSYSGNELIDEKKKWRWFWLSLMRNTSGHEGATDKELKIKVI